MGGRDRQRSMNAGKEKMRHHSGTSMGGSGLKGDIGMFAGAAKKNHVIPGIWRSRRLGRKPASII